MNRYDLATSHLDTSKNRSSFPERKKHREPESNTALLPAHTIHTIRRETLLICILLTAATYIFIHFQYFKVNLSQPHIYHFFMNLVRNTIETRERENIVRPDMLHLLMQAKKEVEQKNASDDLNDVVNKNNQLGKFNASQSNETKIHDAKN